MSAFTALVLLLALSSHSTSSTSTTTQLSANDDSVLDIAAFNVRIFGANKATDQTTMDILVKIILRYDLILIQEIRDSSGTAIQTLLKTLNKELKVPGASYKMKLSPRLGRTASKEEYAYIFRSDLLRCIDSFTFNDHFDVFEREPYVVRFKSDLAAIKEFAVAGIHTSPRDATNEVSNLTKVYDAIQQKWRLDNVIIMGDFNAGCDFVKEWRAIGLAKDPRFYWIIDHSKDTTTGHSDCPYDRIVVAGRDLVKNVIPLSGDVFYFDEEYQLSNRQTLLVSDHYPVHMQIKYKEEAENNRCSHSYIAHDSRIDHSLINKPTKIYQLRSQAKKQSSLFKVSENFKNTGAYQEITIKTEATSGLQMFANLHQLQATFNEFVSINQVKMVKRFYKNSASKGILPHGHGRYQTLFDYYKSCSFLYTVQLVCTLKDRLNPSCSVQAKIEQQ